MIARLAAGATLLLAAAMAGARTNPPAKPPIRMGLWEWTVEMSAVPNMPGAGLQPIRYESCISPEGWEKSMAAALHLQQQQNPDCTPVRKRRDGATTMFDWRCTAQQVITTYHVEMTVDSEESMHGTSTVKTTGPTRADAAKVTAKARSRFLSSACGSVKPGESKTVQQ